MFQRWRQILFFTLLTPWRCRRLQTSINWSLYRAFFSNAFLRSIFIYILNFDQGQLFLKKKKRRYHVDKYDQCTKTWKKETLEIHSRWILWFTFLAADALPLAFPVVGLLLVLAGADAAADSVSDGSSGEMSDSGWLTAAAGAVAGRAAFALTGLAGKFGFAASKHFTTLSFEVACKDGQEQFL